MPEDSESSSSALPPDRVDTAATGAKESEGSEPGLEWNAPPALAAVAAVYSSERSDLGGLLAQSLTLTSIGVAYMGVAAGFLSRAETDTAGVLLRLALAFPAWTVGAYLLIILANVFKHNGSVRILETRLVDAAGWDAAIGKEVGARVGEEITNVKTQGLPLRVQTVFAYGGIYILIVGFTCYCIYNALTVGDRGWTTEVFIAVGVYGLAGVTCALTAGWVLKLNEDNQELADHLSRCAGRPDCGGCENARKNLASRRS